MWIKQKSQCKEVGLETSGRRQRKARGEARQSDQELTLPPLLFFSCVHVKRHKVSISCFTKLSTRLDEDEKMLFHPRSLRLVGVFADEHLNVPTSITTTKART